MQSILPDLQKNSNTSQIIAQDKNWKTTAKFFLQRYYYPATDAFLGIFVFV